MHAPRSIWEQPSSNTRRALSPPTCITLTLARHHAHPRYFLLPCSQAFFPHAVEPAVGVNRLMLAFLCDGLQEERVPGGSGDDGGTRTVLRLHDRLAPYKAAVLPVVKKEPLTKLGEDLHARMLQHLPVEYDVTQSVGKRYRRQDEIGTPLCITVDNQSTSDGTVTVRDRDSMAQVRLHVDDIVARCETGRFSRQALAGTFEAARTAGTGSA